MFSSSGLNDKDGLSYGFKVSMSSSGKRGLPVDSGALLFNSCDGIQSEIEVQFLNDGTSLDRVLPVRGRITGGIISFSRGVGGSGGAAEEFFTWFHAVCDSSAVLKKKLLNITLVDSGNQGKVLAKWEVKGAWPCKWVGPFLDTAGTSPAVEHLSFAYESIQKV